MLDTIRLTTNNYSVKEVHNLTSKISINENTGELHTSYFHNDKANHIFIDVDKNHSDLLILQCSMPKVILGNNYQEINPDIHSLDDFYQKLTQHLEGLGISTDIEFSKLSRVDFSRVIHTNEPVETYISILSESTFTIPYLKHKRTDYSEHKTQTITYDNPSRNRQFQIYDKNSEVINTYDVEDIYTLPPDFTDTNRLRLELRYNRKQTIQRQLKKFANDNNDITLGTVYDMEISRTLIGGYYDSIVGNANIETDNILTTQSMEKIMSTNKNPLFKMLLTSLALQTEQERKNTFQHFKRMVELEDKSDRQKYRLKKQIKDLEIQIQTKSKKELLKEVKEKI